MIFALSLTIAAVIKLDSSLSVKIIILGVLFIGLLWMQYVADGIDWLCAYKILILHSLLTISTSIEMARLEPEKKRPVREDMEPDKLMLEIQRQVDSNSGLVVFLALGTLVIGILMGTIAILISWDFVAFMFS